MCIHSKEITWSTHLTLEFRLDSSVPQTLGAFRRVKRPSVFETLTVNMIEYSKQKNVLTRGRHFVLLLLMLKAPLITGNDGNLKPKNSWSMRKTTFITTAYTSSKGSWRTSRLPNSKGSWRASRLPNSKSSWRASRVPKFMNKFVSQCY